MINKIIHLADISNTLKPFSVSKTWVDLLFKEFYNQEDPVNKSCFTYSKLNRYYVFQNEDDGSVKVELESKKYEFKPDKSKFNIASQLYNSYFVSDADEVGFNISVIAEGQNPIYSIKYSSNQHPIIGFSKTYDDAFNPQSEFAAILTCNHADENCPFIAGAEQRIPITYIDPKVSDNTPLQQETYYKRSIQIATEMKFIFSNIKK